MNTTQLDRTANAVAKWFNVNKNNLWMAYNIFKMIIREALTVVTYLSLIIGVLVCVYLRTIYNVNGKDFLSEIGALYFLGIIAGLICVILGWKHRYGMLAKIQLIIRNIGLVLISPIFILGVWCIISTLSIYDYGIPPLQEILTHIK
jgi:hypothetical protein